MENIIYSIVGWSLIGLSVIILIDRLIPVFLRIKKFIKGTYRRICKTFLGIYRQICKISLSDVLGACKIILSGILAACKAILIDYPTRFMFIGTFQLVGIAFTLCMSKFAVACNIDMLEICFDVIYSENVLWEYSQLVDFIENFLPFADFWFIIIATVMNIIGAVVTLLILGLLLIFDL